MKRMLVLVIVLVAVSLLSGCSDGSDSTTVVTSGPPTTPSTAATPTTSESTTTTTMPLTTTSVTVSFENASIFTAELSGTEVVPAVETQATGTAIIKIDPTSMRAYFKLTVSNLDGVLASRVHEGKVGSNGQGLLILYPGPTVEGITTGVLAQGYFGSSALIGSLTGKSLADFAIMLQSGSAYVNVGTVKNPAGELRGQLMEGSAE